MKYVVHRSFLVDIRLHPYAFESHCFSVSIAKKSHPEHTRILYDLPNKWICRDGAEVCFRLAPYNACLRAG